MQKIELYKFQKEAVAKLGTPELASRLLGDDMGLGKTVEVIVMDIKLRIKTKGTRSGPCKTLIIAPLSVHEHWSDHVKMLWPNARVYCVDRTGTPAQGRQLFAKALQSPNWDYYIIHYEACRSSKLFNLLPVMRKVKFFHIVADEVHRIKNRKAQQTRAIKSFGTTFKTGASGTWADDKPQDAWSVLNWLYPSKFRSYWRYVGDYCEQETTCQECGGTSMYTNGPVVHTSRCSKTGPTFRKIVGVNKATIGGLHKQMAPFYLRRRKTDPGILDELPEKYYTDIVVDLTPRQRKSYDQMKKDMLSWIGEHEDQPLTAAVVAAQLIRLQQFALASAHIEMKPVITKRERELAKEQGRDPEGVLRRVIILEEPSSKLDALSELIDDHPNEQFVVFTQFRSMVYLVAKRLGDKKISTGMYTGDIREQAIRDRTVSEFQRGSLQVFVGTIAAGGESINLNSASTVVLLDRHWTPTRNNQAIDRLHRIGQKNPVQVVDIVARNTVDLGRRAKIAQKWENLKYILGDTVNPEVYEELTDKEDVDVST